MTEGVIIALITGGLAFMGVIVRMLVNARVRSVVQKDDLIEKIEQLEAENTRQHGESSHRIITVDTKLDRVAAKVDNLERKIDHHQTENTRHFEDWLLTHAKLTDRIGQLEGKIWNR